VTDVSHDTDERPRSNARDRGKWRYKMKDLCEASGLERQAIHFYIQQGLLPPGHKTGRNMAWYAEEHLERLHLIRKLQQERFLPLKAIKALLDGRDEDFSPEQQAFLGRVKERLDVRVSGTTPATPVPLDELTEKLGVDPRDVEEAIELGTLAVSEQDGRRMVAEKDMWLLELFAKMRGLGFTRELGFTIEDVTFYETIMNRLFREEMRLVSRRMTNIPPEQAAKMIENALPIIHTILTRYHESLIDDFFGTV